MVEKVHTKETPRGTAQDGQEKEIPFPNPGAPSTSKPFIPGEEKIGYSINNHQVEQQNLEGSCTVRHTIIPLFLHSIKAAKNISLLFPDRGDRL